MSSLLRSSREGARAGKICFSVRYLLPSAGRSNTGDLASKLSHRRDGKCWNWQEGVSSSPQKVLGCENRGVSLFPRLLSEDLIILHPFQFGKPREFKTVGFRHSHILCIAIPRTQLYSIKKKKGNLKGRLPCFVLSQLFPSQSLLADTNISRDCKPQTCFSVKNSSQHLRLGDTRSGWYTVYLFCVATAQRWVLEGSRSLATSGKLLNHPNLCSVQWSKWVGVYCVMKNARATGCCQNKSNMDVGCCLLGAFRYDF